MTAPDVWRSVDQQVSLGLGEFAAQIDISFPGRGLCGVSARGKSIGPARLLAASFVGQQNEEAQTVADSFIRERDLVVTYAQRPTLPVRLQVYWRALGAAEAPGCLGGVDVQVSVQTSLLDAWPALAIRSLLPSGNIVRLVRDEAGQLAAETTPAPAGAWMWRLPQCGVTYAEFAHPADVVHDELFVVDATTCAISRELFTESLEKGVILRGRVRGVFIASKDDVAAIQANYAQYLSLPLPLTT